MYAKKASLLLSLALAVVGCSNDDSNNGNNNVTPPAVNSFISGMIVDTPINGARLAIVNSMGTQLSICGSSGALPCSTFSNVDGEFSFIFPDNTTDLSGKRIVSFGGSESILGRDYTQVQLSADISQLVIDDSNSSSAVRQSVAPASNVDVIVSPMSTLVSAKVEAGTSLETALNEVATSLGLTADVLLSNPMENDLLARMTYFVSHLMQDGISATDINNGLSLIDFSNPSSFVTAINTIYGSDAVGAGVASQLMGALMIADFSDIATGLQTVASTNNYLYFDIVARGTLSNYPSDNATSDNYTASMGGLIAKIAELNNGNVYTNSFLANNLLSRFISETEDITGDSFFADYNNFDNATAFATELAKINATNNSELASAISTLLNLSSIEHFVSTPVDTLLSANDDLYDYWLNSDKSFVNQAVSMVENTQDDSLLDGIYLEAINTYAKYGEYELAEQFINAFIKGTLNRMNAFRSAGEIIAENDHVKGVEFLEKGVDLFEANRQAYLDAGGQILTEYGDAYVALAQAFFLLGEAERGDTLNDDYHTHIIDHVDDTPTPSPLPGIIPDGPPAPATQSGLLAFYYGQSIEKFVNDGDYEKALALFAPFIDSAERHQATLLRFNSENYSEMVALYSYYFSAVANITLVNPSLETRAFADWQTTYDIIKAFPESANLGANWSSTAPSYYIVNGIDKTNQELDELLATSNPAFVEIGKASAYEAILSAVVLDTGMAAADTNFIQPYIPIDDSEVVDMLEIYLNSLVYQDSTRPGVAKIALDSTEVDNQVGLDALAYMVDTLNDNISKLDANDFDSTVFTFFDTDLGERYTRNSGYARVAEMYIALGDNTSAVNALKDAETFVNAATNSLNKVVAYSYLGYYSMLAGDTTYSNEMFNAALNVTLPAGLDNEEIGEHYLGLAQDYIARGLFAEAATQLESAETSLKTAIVTDEIAGARSTYSDIADHYHAMGDITKAKETLYDLKDILSVDVSYHDFVLINSVIVKLASYGFANEAFDIAEELFANDIPNKNDAISEIANVIATKDDFPNSNIAVSDTDLDGMPDFFLPSATAEQITASGLTRDTDIDGDGTDNEMDDTPFFNPAP